MTTYASIDTDPAAGALEGCGLSTYSGSVTFGLSRLAYDATTT